MTDQSGIIGQVVREVTHAICYSDSVMDLPFRTLVTVNRASTAILADLEPQYRLWRHRLWLLLEWLLEVSPP